MDRRRNAAERLLASYSRFYGITRFDGMDAPETEGVREALKLSVPLLPGGAELTAVCEYILPLGTKGGYKRDWWSLSLLPTRAIARLIWKCHANAISVCH